MHIPTAGFEPTTSQSQVYKACSLPLWRKGANMTTTTTPRRPGRPIFDHSCPHPVSSHQFNQKKEPQLSDQTSPRPDGQTNNFPNVWRGTRRGERERGVVVVRTVDKWDLMVSLRAMPVAYTINTTTVFVMLDAVYCQICAYDTCFVPSFLLRKVSNNAHSWGTC